MVGYPATPVILSRVRFCLSRLAAITLRIMVRACSLSSQTKTEFLDKSSLNIDILGSYNSYISIIRVVTLVTSLILKAANSPSSHTREGLDEALAVIEDVGRKCALFYCK